MMKKSIILLIVFSFGCSSIEKPDSITVSELIKSDFRSLDLPQDIVIQGYLTYKIFPSLFASQKDADSNKRHSAFVVFAPWVNLDQCENNIVEVHGELANDTGFGKDAIVIANVRKVLLSERGNIECHWKKGEKRPEL